MLLPGTYHTGGTIRLRAQYQDDAGELFDPATLTAKTLSPSGREATYTYLSGPELGRTSTGQYFIDVTPNEGGRWTIRWEATTGSATIVLEETFSVQMSPIMDRRYYRSDYR